MKRKLLRCMTALATMFVASCSSELVLEGAPNNGVDGEEVEVTFSISPESAHATMRAPEDGSGPGKKQKVGKGQEVDMLIYAVYEKENGYTLLTQYGLGPVKPEIQEDETVAFTSTNVFESSEAFKTSKIHTGQTIIDVSETIQKGKAQRISLRLMRNKEYYIAFWAQSRKTRAFNTDDLENVQVIYNDAKNNDELRDAFCKVESFSVSPSSQSDSRTVILTRPMAQINVGTTGADYKTVIEDKERVFTESKISFAGAAQFLNVVTNEVLTRDENGNSTLTNVEYSYNKIPAYINMEDLPTGDNRFDGKNDNEELLWVDLNNDGDFEDYTIEYPTLGKNPADADYFKTEIFKYLSMCYVLVPATETKIPNYDSEDENTTSSQESYNSSLLKNVKVSIFGANDDGSVKEEKECVNLDNVPVHRNWRTNILCGLYDHNIPNEDDPNDPDDPTSIYKTPYVLLNLNPNFDGEHNGTGDAENRWEFFGTSGN